MKVTNIYQHPDDTPEERRARAQEMLQPVIDDILSHPEEEKDAIYILKEDENGHYLENLNGKRMPVPEWARQYYGLSEGPT